VGVVLGYWVEFAADKFFQLRVYDPVFLLRGFTEHCRVKQIKLLAALKVKFARVFALKLDIVLVNKVVPQRLNRQQTLQTRIHVAEERIVMQTYNPVFKVLIRLLPRDLDDLSSGALGFCVWPALRVLRCLFYSDEALLIGVELTGVDDARAAPKEICEIHEQDFRNF